MVETARAIRAARRPQPKPLAGVKFDNPHRLLYLLDPPGAAGEGGAPPEPASSVAEPKFMTSQVVAQQLREIEDEAFEESETKKRASTPPNPS